MDRFSEITLRPDGGFDGVVDLAEFRGPGRAAMPVRFGATFPLFLIREAWDRGTSFEDLADGFGAGLGTMGGDWSGIRDSSERAVEAMLERALNALFPRRLQEPVRGAK